MGDYGVSYFKQYNIIHALVLTVLYRLHGDCVPYSDEQLERSSICDYVFQAGTDYVYFQHSRFPNSSSTELREVLEDITETVEFITGPCREVAATLLCIHFLSPCGHNSLLHVPTFICPDFCEYVSTELCYIEWMLAETQIPMYHGEQYSVPKCNRTGEHLKALNLSSDCCANGDIYILPG